MNDREYNALTDKLNHANAEIDRLLGIIDRITESNENKDARGF
jgi:peptidoglycan hydrolase CwlO-like protein